MKCKMLSMVFDLPSKRHVSHKYYVLFINFLIRVSVIEKLQFLITNSWCLITGKYLGNTFSFSEFEKNRYTSIRKFLFQRYNNIEEENLTIFTIEMFILMINYCIFTKKSINV